MTSVGCFSCENISLIKTCIGLVERDAHRHVQRERGSPTCREREVYWRVERERFHRHVEREASTVCRERERAIDLTSMEGEREKNTGFVGGE
jgi:hypothetical protein